MKLYHIYIIVFLILFLLGFLIKYSPYELTGPGIYRIVLQTLQGEKYDFNSQTVEISK